MEKKLQTIIKQVRNIKMKKKKQVKDLAIIEKIENNLKEPRKEIVFPLQALHRKELRQLRDENIGNLQTQISVIKGKKKDEYKKKYGKEIRQELDEHLVTVQKLNDDYKRFKEKAQKLIQDRRELEKSLVNEYISIDADYYELINLIKNKESKFRREASINIGSQTSNIDDKRYKERYGKAFETVQNEISKLNTTYEEAINFGDLEVVKTLYYKFKDAEILLEKIRKMNI